MFMLRKIISQFFFPLPLSLSICLIGLSLLWFTRKQRTGKVLVTTGVCLLLLFSFNPVANALLFPLEAKYAPYAGLSNNPPQFIVVLGGGHGPDARLSATSRLSDESLKRLIEGILLHRTSPNSKLLLSGGSWLGRTSDAEVMADVAKRLGVGDADLILEQESHDTKNQSLLLRPVVHTNRFILVTSAAHMPRSMALFRKAGMHPIAAPVDHRVKKSDMKDPHLYCPHGSVLRKSETAIYEYLGLVWAKYRKSI